ncbi:penicillin-binding protein [Paenibacillus baekrokdamisoli]|uniref:Penicillin-binding protein n=1 Tax=Paenibacillus baekrokdamisoli TaxID=1712516 RepID=A0A3G9JFN3_9BACL|nr:serine hydrolase domain-containing protein [Paenibacillus baekrokdamisoli]MBB3071722.1 CubicO group peptidase (beta-lactamase class C family) [Paenibacillus baekrokdamisoli]BBH21769.1 penicillin-binding protein [Paenibacillus baekrokdamisoli]
MTMIASLQTTTPEEASFRPEVLVRLEQLFQNLIQENQLQSASYLLAKDGKIVASSAMGRRTYKNDDDSPMLTDTIRRIASVTKLFGAVAIFQLIEQGKLFLKQAVSEWIEEFKHPMFERIQIWHLLTHTSGLWPDPGYYNEPNPFGHWDVRFAFEPDNEDTAVNEDERLKLRKSAWIRSILSLKPVCKPGENWNYSSAGYALIGEIVSRASGMHFEEYVIKHITEPLGMNRTFFDVPAELHGEICVTNEWDVSRLDKRDRTYDPPRTGGGLYSTLEDLFRFGQMLLNNGSYEGRRILSRKSIERMTRNHFEGRNLFAYSWGGKVASMPYGMGPGVTLENEWISAGAYGHEGAGRSKLIIDPKHNAVIVFFVPSNSDWVPESIITPLQIIGSGWK